MDRPILIAFRLDELAEKSMLTVFIPLVSQAYTDTDCTTAIAHSTLCD